MNPHFRTRIKMCGVTRMKDAAVAVEEGVDALGFIFYERSPRSIDPEEARLIIAELPPLVQAVGVFVDTKRKEVEEIVRYCGLGLVQLHGAESAKYCERLNRRITPCQVLKALRVGPSLTAGEAQEFEPFIHGYVLDTYVEGVQGGTGATFDWKRIDLLDLQRPCLLAGGLGPDNILEALEAARPYGVDVNSGVETAPGIKDAKLIRRFIRTVRNYDTTRLNG